MFELYRCKGNQFMEGIQGDGVYEYM